MIHYQCFISRKIKIQIHENHFLVASQFCASAVILCAHSYTRSCTNTERYCYTRFRFAPPPGVRFISLFRFCFFFLFCYFRVISVVCSFAFLVLLHLFKALYSFDDDLLFAILLLARFVSFLFSNFFYVSKMFTLFSHLKPTSLLWLSPKRVLHSRTKQFDVGISVLLFTHAHGVEHAAFVFLFSSFFEGN